MPVLIAALAVILCDQWSKYYVQAHMGSPGNSFPVIDGVFHISYVLNPGAAFGILQHKTFFFIAVAGAMIAAAVYFYHRLPPEYRLIRLGMGLMAGGAVGNVIDRVQTGYVVDFLDFRIWPVFNIADSAIVVGVGLIMYSMWISTRKEDAQ